MTRNHRFQGFGLSVGVLIAMVACSTPSQPSPPGPPPVPPPSGGLQTTLTGSVVDYLNQPLGGVRVEIVDGQQAGHSITTDDTGSFVLVGTFSDATRVRAAKEGYLDRSTSISGWWTAVGPASRSVTFSLVPVTEEAGRPPVFMAGDRFTLTLAADDACTTIPAEFRTRTYEMTVSGPSPDGKWFGATASGKEFLEGHNGFPMEVTNDVVRFQLDEDGFPYMAERVASNAYLAFIGVPFVPGVRRGAVIAASFRGWVSYCEVASPGGDYYLTASRECPSTPLALGSCDFFQLMLVPRG